MSVRLVQCCRAGGDRVVAMVDEPTLRVLSGCKSVYSLAQDAIEKGERIERLVQSGLGSGTLDYEEVYAGRSDWRLMLPIDHPFDPAHCLVTGTGLSHRKSADNRNAMHTSAMPSAETDSMRMYRFGEEGGRPAPGGIGAAPEWFWKGDGGILRAHAESLVILSFAEDGGDEAEIAGIYLSGPDGVVRRIGLAQGNEFSDHVLESTNYLYLAPSKLRHCSLGPEIVIDAEFEAIAGEAAVLRNAQQVWSQPLLTGEAHMVHSLANLEHHQFKYPQHRRPGDVHIHFFGTPGFSFGSGIRLLAGDVMRVSFEGFGRPLLNTIEVERRSESPVKVWSL